MITVNKDSVLHFGGRPFLNPSPPHALIMGHAAGNNWSHGSNSKISFEWTRAGSHAMGTQVCQQPAMFFFSYSNRGKDRVCFQHPFSHVSLFFNVKLTYLWLSLCSAALQSICTIPLPIILICFEHNEYFKAMTVLWQSWLFAIQECFVDMQLKQCTHTNRIKGIQREIWRRVWGLQIAPQDNSF